MLNENLVPPEMSLKMHVLFQNFLKQTNAAEESIFSLAYIIFHFLSCLICNQDATRGVHFKNFILILFQDFRNGIVLSYPTVLEVLTPFHRSI